MLNKQEYHPATETVTVLRYTQHLTTHTDDSESEFASLTGLATTKKTTPSKNKKKKHGVHSLIDSLKQAMKHTRLNSNSSALESGSDDDTIPASNHHHQQYPYQYHHQQHNNNHNSHHNEQVSTDSSINHYARGGLVLTHSDSTDGLTNHLTHTDSTEPLSSLKSGLTSHTSISNNSRNRNNNNNHRSHHHSPDQSSLEESPWLGWIRALAWRVKSSTSYLVLYCVLIAMNAFVLIWEVTGHPRQDVAVLVEGVITVLFLLEISVEIVTQTWPIYWRTWMNRLDLSVCMCCVILWLVFVSVEEAPEQYTHHEIESVLDAMVVSVRYSVQFIRLLRFANKGRTTRSEMRDLRDAADPIVFDTDLTQATIDRHSTGFTRVSLAGPHSGNGGSNIGSGSGLASDLNLKGKNDNNNIDNDNGIDSMDVARPSDVSLIPMPPSKNRNSNGDTEMGLLSNQHGLHQELNDCSSSEEPSF